MPPATMAPRGALGFTELLALGVNGIVGVGIFFAPSEVARVVPGVAGLLVYGLVVACFVPIAFVYAKLGARFEANGGPYVWAEAAFGTGAAFFIGWLTYVSAIFSAAAVLSGIATHAGSVLGLTTVLQVRSLGVLVAGILSGVVLLGLKPSAHVWTGFTVAKLLPLCFLVLMFAIVGPETSARSGPVEGQAPWTRAALAVVFALQGFEIVPVLAKNARHFSRTIPMATVLALVIVGFVYVLVHWVCVRTLPQLASSERPLVDAAGALAGSQGSLLLGWGTTLSALGIAFGMFAVTPHYLAVLGQLPGLSWFSQTDRHDTPRRAVIVTLMAVVCLVGLGGLSELLVLSSVAVMSQYAVCGLALLRLALARRFGLVRRDAWPAPLALFGIALLIRGAEARELVVAFVVVLLGALVYGFRRRD